MALMPGMKLGPYDVLSPPGGKQAARPRLRSRQSQGSYGEASP
jgi:hypothetical protein